MSINDVMRGFDGSEPIGKRWDWAGGTCGHLTAIVRPQGTFSPLVELRYRFDRFNADAGQQTQYVDVQSSPCRFGGIRWWWECPKTHRRAAKLYLPFGGHRFWSRQAYGLNYQSQRETWLDRAHRKSGRLHQKLGGKYQGLMTEFPVKPKGMHWRTYNDIGDQIDAVEHLINLGFTARVGALMERCGGT